MTILRIYSQKIYVYFSLPIFTLILALLNSTNINKINIYYNNNDNINNYNNKFNNTKYINNNYSCYRQLSCSSVDSSDKL